MKPRKVDRTDARTLLMELRQDLWMWRMATMTRKRRSLAMRVRWRLRWLEGLPEAVEAAQAVEDALAARRRCGQCGQVVRPHTRLRRKRPCGSQMN